MKMPTVNFDDSVAEAKRAYIIDVVRQHEAGTFVETGTSEGHTVARMIGNVGLIVSIEIRSDKYLQSTMQFLDEPSVKLVFGDSGELLGRLAAALDGVPAVFYLDAHAHASGSTPATTPIETELRHVLHNRVGNDVILIDDADLFGVERGYPTLEHVRQLIETWHGPTPRMRTFVAHNMIHAVPCRSSICAEVPAFMEATDGDHGT